VADLLIGIDASRAISPRPTGTEIYSQQLIAALTTVDLPYRYRLYFRSSPGDAFSTAERRVIPFPRMWTHVRLSWEMAQHPPDILFVPAHVLPPIRPKTSLVTIHDLGYLHFPGSHPPLQRFYLDLSTRWNARVATHILADSEATKADLVKHYGTPCEKITIAYPGYDEHLAPVCEPEEMTAVRAHYNIPERYFLYVGTLHPRKNLSHLIDSFARLLQTSHPDVSLVLAGRRGWLYSEIFAQVEGLGLTNRVLFPGYVREEDKAALLSGAIAFVFPSLYEGFGLPVLEAQACGCPVICSNTSSLPEVAGSGALLVDPSDPAALIAAMGRLADDVGLRADLIVRGHANLARFSWSQCAQTVLSTIKNLVASGR
jgi:glycosyltransferase involved in cell wall biosynthesis